MPIAVTVTALDSLVPTVRGACSKPFTMSSLNSHLSHRGGKSGSHPRGGREEAAGGLRAEAGLEPRLPASLACACALNHSSGSSKECEYLSFLTFVIFSGAHSVNAFQPIPHRKRRQEEKKRGNVCIFQ